MTSEVIEKDLLDLVFGTASLGKTPDSRAASSRQQFVRGQVQLAPASDQATGRRLTAIEALTTFGWHALRSASEEGTFSLVTDPREPAATLKARREALGLTTAQVARAAGVETAAVVRAETPGLASDVRDLERVAQALALDERVLGYVPEANGDRALGVRLRELTRAKDATRFSSQAVAGLSEAAWVVARQSILSEALSDAPDPLVSGEHQRDWDYGYPTWKQGYRLANRTRTLLAIGDQPIPSMRQLLEVTLGIPLVQQSMDERFAGATIANGRHRGIVINERGANENVWVRRMTLCHELGHLLWDPDQQLNHLTVDDYPGIERDYFDVGPDRVEIRANAFAVAFLAPPSEVKRLADTLSDADSTVSAVINRFGISLSAARYHVKNVTGIETAAVHLRDSPSDEWRASENLTIDFFPLRSTPITRRGRFANRVIEAHARGFVSTDTAAMALRCSVKEFEAAAPALRDITGQ